MFSTLPFMVPYRTAFVPEQPVPTCHQANQRAGKRVCHTLTPPWHRCGRPVEGGRPHSAPAPYHAPNGGAGARVHWEKQPMGLQGGVQIVPPNPRLHGGVHVLGAHRQHGVHAGEGNAHATQGRGGVALQASPTAVGHNLRGEKPMGQTCSYTVHMCVGRCGKV